MLSLENKALEAYKKGHSYFKAIELASSVETLKGEVLKLREAYGDWLLAQRQFDAASNHYIQAACYEKVSLLSLCVYLLFSVLLLFDLFSVLSFLSSSLSSLSVLSVLSGHARLVRSQAMDPRDRVAVPPDHTASQTFLQTHCAILCMSPSLSFLLSPSSSSYLVCRYSIYSVLFSSFLFRLFSSLLLFFSFCVYSHFHFSSISFFVFLSFFLSFKLLIPYLFSILTFSAFVSLGVFSFLV
jgi:hypothetical protein